MPGVQFKVRSQKQQLAKCLEKREINKNTTSAFRTLLSYGLRSP